MRDALLIRRIGRQVEAVEARVRLGKLRDLARLFERKAARTVRALEVLESAGPQWRSSVSRVQGGTRLQGTHPLTGIRLVPVVNWSKRDFFSVGHDLTACQNHLTTSSSFE